MPAPTVADLLARHPALSSLDDSILQAAIDDSSAMLDEPTWGTFYARAVCLDAAHELALDNLTNGSIEGAFQATGGPIASVSGGGLSTTFAPNGSASRGSTAEWYAKTIYGQAFLQLRSRVLPMADVSI